MHEKFTFYCSSIKTQSLSNVFSEGRDLHSTVVLLKRFAIQ